MGDLDILLHKFMLSREPPSFMTGQHTVIEPPEQEHKEWNTSITSTTQATNKSLSCDLLDFCNWNIWEEQGWVDHNGQKTKYLLQKVWNRPHPEIPEDDDFWSVSTEHFKSMLKISRPLYTKTSTNSSKNPAETFSPFSFLPLRREICWKKKLWHQDMDAVKSWNLRKGVRSWKSKTFSKPAAAVLVIPCRRDQRAHHAAQGREPTGEKKIKAAPFPSNGLETDSNWFFFLLDEQ